MVKETDTLDTGTSSLENDTKSILIDSMTMKECSSEKNISSIRRMHQRSVEQTTKLLNRELKHIDHERARIAAQKERLQSLEFKHREIQRQRFKQGIKKEKIHIEKEKARFLSKMKR